MKDITIELDDWGHRELEEYLLTVPGINSVKTNDATNIKIDINYDSQKINSKMIRMELDLFFDRAKEPSLISFDKHEPANNSYKIKIKYLCCEYCLKGMIEDLYDTNGIISCKSNFDFVKPEKQRFKNVLLNITYNDIIDIDKIKELEKGFNL